jgi:hypothetical protein
MISGVDIKKIRDTVLHLIKSKSLEKRKIYLPMNMLNIL